MRLRARGRRLLGHGLSLLRRLELLEFLLAGTGVDVRARTRARAPELLDEFVAALDQWLELGEEPLRALVAVLRELFQPLDRVLDRLGPPQSPLLDDVAGDGADIVELCPVRLQVTDDVAWGSRGRRTGAFGPGEQPRDRAVPGERLQPEHAAWEVARAVGRGEPAGRLASPPRRDVRALASGHPLMVPAQDGRRYRSR